jgi:hypothetical protein
MADVHPYWYGVVVELDHNETQQVLGAIAGGGAADAALRGVLGAAGAAVAGAAIPVIAAYLAVEGGLIAAVDHGAGVILTMTWAAPGVVVPTTRHQPDIPDDWATRTDGTFHSAGGDEIDWHVDHNTLHTLGDPSGSVRFYLDNQTPSHWDKAFILRDGLGSEWTVLAHAGQQPLANNGLEPGQWNNGQQFTFRKPGFLGVWTDVFPIGGLGNLNGDDVVTFTWRVD